MTVPTFKYQQKYRYRKLNSVLKSDDNDDDDDDDDTYDVDSNDDKS